MDKKKTAIEKLVSFFFSTETEMKFEDAKLKDGTIVSSEKMEAGKVLLIVAEDATKSPAPEGEYTFEDGRKVIVKGTEGMIESIVEKTEDEEKEVEMDLEAEKLKAETAKNEEINTLKTTVGEVMKKLEAMELKFSAIEENKKETDLMLATGIKELSENFSKIPGADAVEVRPAKSQFNFSEQKASKNEDIIAFMERNRKKS